MPTTVSAQCDTMERSGQVAVLGDGALEPGRETAPAPGGLSPNRGNPNSAAAKSMAEGRSLCACEEEGVGTL